MVVEDKREGRNGRGEEGKGGEREEEQSGEHETPVLIATGQTLIGGLREITGALDQVKEVSPECFLRLFGRPRGWQDAGRQGELCRDALDRCEQAERRKEELRAGSMRV